MAVAKHCVDGKTGKRDLFAAPKTGRCVCEYFPMISRLPWSIAAWAAGVLLATVAFAVAAYAQPATLSIAAQNQGDLVAEGGTATFQVTVDGLTDLSSNATLNAVCRVDFTTREPTEELEPQSGVDKDAGDDDDDATNDYRRQVTLNSGNLFTDTCAFGVIDDGSIEPDRYLEVVLEADTELPLPDGFEIDNAQNRASVTVTSDERGVFRVDDISHFPAFERPGDYNGFYADADLFYYLDRGDGAVTDLAEKIQFRWDATGSEADAADFYQRSTLSGLLSIQPGGYDAANNSLQEFSMFFTEDDDMVEGFEEYTITFALADSRWARSVSLQTTSMTTYVVDNDGEDVILFWSHLAERDTAAEGGGAARIHLMVSKLLDSPASIPLLVTAEGVAATDWTATNLVVNGEDYSVAIPAQKDFVRIEVTATDDMVWNGGERTGAVTIEIDADNLPSGFVGATEVYPTRVTVPLQDGDPPRLQVALTGSGTGQFQEGNGTYRESITVTILMDRAVFAEDRTLTLATGPSSEASLDDIALDDPAAITVVLPAGARSVTAVWSFGIVDDDLVEGAEMLVVQPTIDGPNADQVDIPEFTFPNPLLDNEMATVGFTTPASSTPVVEGTMVTLMVELSHAVARDVTVSWSVTGVDASDLGSGSLTGTPIVFSAGGSRTQDLSIAIADDSDAEATEAAVVTLEAPTGALSSLVSVDSANATREVVIAFNDGAAERQVTDVAVTSAPTSAFYGDGDTITVTVTFDGNVTVTGTPTIDLMIGDQVQTAEYTGDTDSEVTELTFEYDVGMGEQDHDGVGVVANSLRAGGADSIVAVGTGVFTNLRHAGVANATGQAVDTQAPTVESIEVQSRPIRGDAYGMHERIRVRVTFSEMVTVVGAPTLNLQIDNQVEAAELHTDSFPTAEVVFHHEVGAGESDANGVSIPSDPITLPSGASVRDVVALDADLSQAAGTDLTAHQVDGTVFAAEVADINGDSQVQYDDAIILHNALQFVDLLEVNASSPSSSGIAFRQTFIAPHVRGGQAGSIGTILQSASAAADFADARNSVLDVSGDGELNGHDAAIMFYAWRFPELVGRGRPGVPDGFEQIRLAMFGAHFPSVDPAGARAMLERANAFLGR